MINKLSDVKFDPLNPTLHLSEDTLARYKMIIESERMIDGLKGKLLTAKEQDGLSKAIGYINIARAGFVSELKHVYKFDLELLVQ